MDSSYELKFRTSLGGTLTFYVRNADATVTDTAVKSAADKILEANAFDKSKGTLTEIIGIYRSSTTSTPIGLPQGA